MVTRTHSDDCIRAVRCPTEAFGPLHTPPFGGVRDPRLVEPQRCQGGGRRRTGYVAGMRPPGQGELPRVRATPAQSPRWTHPGESLVAGARRLSHGLRGRWWRGGSGGPGVAGGTAWLLDAEEELPQSEGGEDAGTPLAGRCRPDATAPQQDYRRTQRSVAGIQNTRPRMQRAVRS